LVVNSVGNPLADLIGYDNEENNMLKINTLIMMFWLAVSVNLLAAETQIDTERLKVLQQSLQQQGLVGLLATAQQNGSPAPLIYSQWWVDLITDPKLKTVEQQKRDLGRQLALKLDEEAQRLPKLTTAKDREAALKLLLDLTDWLASSHGYGNLFLLNRSQNLAAVPLAYLTADLSYPASQIELWLSRFKGIQNQIAVRIEILNRELGKEYFKDREYHVSGAKKRLWESYGGEETFKTNGLEYFWSEGLKAVEQQTAKKLKRRYPEATATDRPSLPKQEAFFLDDEARLQIPQPYTTTTWWNLKHHYKVLIGIGGEQLLGEIRYLLLFRQQVGHFPTAPPAWWKEGDSSYYSATDAAFNIAWLPFRGKYGNPPPESTAAKLYERIQRGEIRDDDSEEIRSFNASKAGPK
jgi:hypothetical protein